MTEPSVDVLLKSGKFVVIYDGECPFCGAYVNMLRLRDAFGSVELLNARAYPELVGDCLRRGIDLNDGMLVLYGERCYFGADAVTVLSNLTTASGLINSAVAYVLKRPRLSRLLYPAMRGGRAATLKILGRARL